MKYKRENTKYHDFSFIKLNANGFGLRLHGSFALTLERFHTNTQIKNIIRITSFICLVNLFAQNQLLLFKNYYILW